MKKSGPHKNFHIASLIVKYLRGELTGREKEELEAWKQAGKGNEQLFESLVNTDALESQLEELGKTDPEAGWKRLQEKLGAGKKETKRYLYRKMWQAAAAIFILGLAIWQITSYHLNKPSAHANLASRYGTDIRPGTLKAELILSNGRRISLDSKGDTTFTENGTPVERNADGTLKYGKGENAGGELALNTLYIPNAGEYRVVLADGTKVWLNAASTLRYPVQFTGKERRVELLEGEAYFEVAKNKEKPFIVVANQMEVQAVGTAFNINNYAVADSSMSATLTEGKVKVKTKNEIRFLIPGEQARANTKGMKIIKADVEQVTAWKNGRFIFNNTPLAEVMQQLSRWYDVPIEYDKGFGENKFFTGEIKRNVPVSKLLQMMEMTGIARFRIANNTVAVLPYTK